MNMVRGHFRPEFLNRIDEIILFKRLSRANMGDIVASSCSGSTSCWPTAA
jgi:ATP-dependent Clp protease ATP-binding subunit ClpA